MTDFDPAEIDGDQRAERFFRALERDTDGLVDPVAPQEIRRLGERRRHRRHATVAASTLGLGALAAASALALGGGPGHGVAHPDTAARPSASSHAPSSKPSIPAYQPTSSPTVSARVSRPPLVTSSPSESTAPEGSASPDASPSPSASQAVSSSPQPSSPTLAAPTADNAPDAASMGRFQAGAMRSDWVADTLSGMQEPPSVCAVDLADLGQPTSTRVEHFVGKDSAAYTILLAYETKALATAQRKVVRGWYTGCAARLTAQGRTASQTRAVQLDPADTDRSTFRTVRYSDATSAGTFTEEATIIQRDNRLLWVVYTDLPSEQAGWTDLAGAQPYPGLANADTWDRRLGG